MQFVESIEGVVASGWLVETVGFLVKRPSRILSSSTLGVKDPVDRLVTISVLIGAVVVTVFEVVSSAKLGKGVGVPNMSTILSPKSSPCAKETYKIDKRIKDKAFIFPKKISHMYLVSLFQ